VPGVLSAAGLSDFAAFSTGASCGSISMAGNASTDSFDSTKGTYAQTKQLNGGNLGTAGNVSLNGNVTVNGFIAALSAQCNPLAGTTASSTASCSVTFPTGVSLAAATATW
jgi:hypothetical protein